MFMWDWIFLTEKFSQTSTELSKEISELILHYVITF